MIKIGYHMSSEEHRPNVLVDNAIAAEQARFDFLTISDHFHPWISQQGQSPFVWSVVGALARETELPVMTAVTCPLIRTHPLVIAQAAATCEDMMPGRFTLGLGSGENLNEHVTGDAWPAPDVRLEMLEEAIDVIRQLFSGEEVTHRGKYYTVDHARLFTMPAKAPPITVAASGSQATSLAAKKGDGLVATSPDADQVKEFTKGSGDKPRYGMLHVCWAEDETQARKVALKWWPNSSLKGEMSSELPYPRHFEQAAEMVTEEDIAKEMVCGPDADKHVDAVNEYIQAGFDHIFVHQVGPDQQGFIRFFSDEVLPKVR